MHGISASFAHQLLNTLRGEPLAVAAVYARLHSRDPGGQGVDNTSAGTAQLLPIVFAPAADGVLPLDGPRPVWTNTGGVTETISYVAVFDGDGPGAAFLWSAPVTPPKTWEAGDTLDLGVGGLTVTLLAAD